MAVSTFGIHLRSAQLPIYSANDVGARPRRLVAVPVEQALPVAACPAGKCIEAGAGLETALGVLSRHEGREVPAGDAFVGADRVDHVDGDREDLFDGPVPEGQGAVLAELDYHVRRAAGRELGGQLAAARPGVAVG